MSPIIRNVLLIALVASSYFAEAEVGRKRALPVNDLTVRMKLSKRTSLENRAESAPKLANKLKSRHMMDSMFVGEIGVGSPEQKMRVTFDTNSANVWVPSKKCTTCEDFFNRYDSSLSKTYKADNTPIWDHYGTPLVEGFASMDDVSVAGSTVRNQTFGEATYYRERNPYVDEAEGVFGLSFDKRAVNGIKTPLRNMLDQGLISKLIVSIYLSPNQTASPGGEVIFGGIDELLLDGDITYTPVVLGIDWNDWMWQIQQIVLTSGGKVAQPIRVCRGGCIGWAYTACPVIEGPLMDIRMLNDAIGARSPDGDPGHFYLPDCNLNGLPNLEVVIEAQRFSIKPEQYIIKERQGGEEICMSAFVSLGDESPVWSLGASFIGNVYTVLDYENKRMGFARSK